MLEELKKKEPKAKNYLFQAIDRWILEKSSAKKLPRSLGFYEKEISVIITDKKAATSSITFGVWNALDEITRVCFEFFSRTMASINKMRVHGEVVEDLSTVGEVLRSMTPKFNLWFVQLKNQRILIIFQLMNCKVPCWSWAKIDSTGQRGARFEGLYYNPSLTPGRGDRGRGKGKRNKRSQKTASKLWNWSILWFFRERKRSWWHSYIFQQHQSQQTSHKLSASDVTGTVTSIGMSYEFV